MAPIWCQHKSLLEVGRILYNACIYSRTHYAIVRDIAAWDRRYRTIDIFLIPLTRISIWKAKNYREIK